MSLADRIDRAEPGPWRDCLVAYRDADAAHKELCARDMPLHERYYDLKLDPKVIEEFHPELSTAVARIEASGVALVGLRGSLPNARDAAFFGKAAVLGAAPVRDGEPTWVRLMRDLHALREWRADRLDGIDVNLAPFLLQPVGRGSPPGLTAPAFQAWAKAHGAKPREVLARVSELAGAGLIPGVSHDHERCPLPVAVNPARLEALAAREDPETLAGEVRFAAEVLPAGAFPVPEEALAALAAASSPRP
jgi:hypothetical protein